MDFEDEKTECADSSTKSAGLKPLFPEPGNVVVEDSGEFIDKVKSSKARGAAGNWIDSIKRIYA